MRSKLGTGLQIEVVALVVQVWALHEVVRVSTVGSDQLQAYELAKQAKES